MSASLYAIEFLVITGTILAAAAGLRFALRFFQISQVTRQPDLTRWMPPNLTHLQAASFVQAHGRGRKISRKHDSHGRVEGCRRRCQACLASGGGKVTGIMERPLLPSQNMRRCLECDFSFKSRKRLFCRPFPWRISPPRNGNAGTYRDTGIRPFFGLSWTDARRMGSGRR